MLSLRLVRLLDTHAEQLADTLFEVFQRSPECSDLRKLPPDQLRVRTHEIYRNLSDWLVDGTKEEIAVRYIALGLERASQDVALSHFVWAIGATKAILHDFLEREGMSDTPVEMHASLDLLAHLDRFFDSAIYYASVGYERYYAAQTRAVSVA